MRPPCVRHLPCAANAATITGPASKGAARNGPVDKPAAPVRVVAKASKPVCHRRARAQPPPRRRAEAHSESRKGENRSRAANLETAGDFGGKMPCVHQAAEVGGALSVPNAGRRCRITFPRSGYCLAKANHEIRRCQQVLRARRASVSTLASARDPNALRSAPSRPRSRARAICAKPMLARLAVRAKNFPRTSFDARSRLRRRSSSRRADRNGALRASDFFAAQNPNCANRARRAPLASIANGKLG